MKRRIETNRFPVISDHGRQYVVIEEQDYITVNALSSPPEEIQGLKSLSTTTGYSVNYIDDNTFKIVETYDIVHKVND